MKFNILLKISIVFLVVVFAWIFTSFSLTWQNLPILLRVQQVKAEVKPLKIKGKIINFVYTDDNRNENLIIKTNKKTYIGLTRADVYFSVTNIGDKPERVNLQAYFPKSKGEVKKIEKWKEDVPYEVEVPDFGPTGYFCQGGWQSASVSTYQSEEKVSLEELVQKCLEGGKTEGECLIESQQILKSPQRQSTPLVSNQYYCPSTGQSYNCNDLSPDNKNCILNNVKIGSHKEIKYKDDWQYIELSNKALSISQGVFNNFFGRGIKRKAFPQNFQVKKSTRQEGNQILTGQTQYFKMEIEFPLDSSGEFYIEAIGDKEGYGLLDPWWNSNWDYRKKITITGASSAKTNYQIEMDVNYGSGTDSGKSVYLNSKCQTDFDDIRFISSDGSTEIDYWREEYTASDDATFWVKVPSIPASPSTVEIYIYYGNSGVVTTSNFSNTFPNNHILDGESETLDGTKNYDWFEIKNSGTINITTGQSLTINARVARIGSGSTINGNNDGYAGGTGTGCANGDNGSGSNYGVGAAHNCNDDSCTGCKSSLCTFADDGEDGSGGGGAGYGGAGGQGGQSWTTGDCDSRPGCGGVIYGNASDDTVYMGAGGGSGTGSCYSSNDGTGGNGGRGGSYLNLDAPDITIAGTVTMNGADGAPGNGCSSSYGCSGGGGGAGGTIRIIGKTVNLDNGTFAANGGAGGARQGGSYGGAGGGGGGGRIKIIYEGSLSETSAVYTVTGGDSGGDSYQDPQAVAGSDGTIHKSAASYSDPSITGWGSEETEPIISISISDGVVSYGTVPLGHYKDTIQLSDTQTATNDGNTTEDFNIEGANTANWTLANASGTDQYVHQFSINGGSSWTDLTTSYQTLVTGIAASGTKDFDLRIWLPSSTTYYTQQNPNVTIQAVQG